MDFWHYYFAWWQGNVWGNVIASIMCGIVVALYTRILVRNLHKKHQQHHADIKASLDLLHRKIDERNNL